MAYTRTMRLDFDPIKDVANLEKHGLSLADALLVYDAPEKLTLSSSRQGEQRIMDIASVAPARLVLVLVYVVRGDVLRAISLRPASRAERMLYETA